MLGGINMRQPLLQLRDDLATGFGGGKAMGWPRYWYSYCSMEKSTHSHVLRM
jgi:hypothetical protein